MNPNSRFEYWVSSFKGAHNSHCDYWVAHGNIVQASLKYFLSDYTFPVRHSMTDPEAPRSILDSSFLNSSSS